MYSASVIFWTSSSVVSWAISLRIIFRSESHSNTAMSVISWLTHLELVKGSFHFFKILISSFLVTCSIITITFLALCERSIAPPNPLTFLPGTIQLAKSPLWDTWKLPRIVIYTLGFKTYINVPSSDHPKWVWRAEKTSSFVQFDRLLACVD